MAVVALEAGPAHAFGPVLARWRTEHAAQVEVFVAPAAERYLEGQPVEPSATHCPLDMTRYDAILMSASGRPLERAVRAAAAQAATPVLQFVDQWYNYAERFPAGDSASWPDRIGVIDLFARQEAIAAGLPPDRLICVGNPAWEGLAPLPAASPAQCLFLDQPLGREYGGRLGYDEGDAWCLVAEVAALRPDLMSTLCFCPHPSMPPPPADRLPAGSILADLDAGLRRCGTVIGMFSSALVSAYLGGRRVISIQPAQGTADRCVLSRRGLVPRVTDAAGLVAALEQPTIGDDRLCTDLRGSTARLGAAVLALGSP